MKFLKNIIPCVIGGLLGVGIAVFFPTLGKLLSWPSRNPGKAVLWILGVGLILAVIAMIHNKIKYGTLLHPFILGDDEDEEQDEDYDDA